MVVSVRGVDVSGHGLWGAKDVPWAWADPSWSRYWSPFAYEQEQATGGDFSDDEVSL